MVTVPSLWTSTQPFVLSSTDLREVRVQINNIRTRARAAPGPRVPMSTFSKSSGPPAMLPRNCHLDHFGPANPTLAQLHEHLFLSHTATTIATTNQTQR